MLRLERRATPSSTMSIVSPLLAAAGMLVTGFLLFSALGKDPFEAFYLFFIKPLSSMYGIGELLLKTTPLLLCGLGLALGFRANVWNIGAEGQLTMGAIAGGGVALWFGDAADAGGRRARRHGLGGHSSLPAHPVQHQRNPGDVDVGVHRRTGAVLAGARAMARSAGTKLSAIPGFR
jgi:Branched-chain amino acid transport system / permease component